MDATQPLPSARTHLLLATIRAQPLTLAVALAATLAATYFALVGLMLHWSFNSYGWDLGIFDQILWNTAHGHPYDYSFRTINYLGDHFQPVLLLLTPLAYLGVGPTPLLVVQGIAFAAAAVPLYAATRRLAGPLPAALLAAAYLVSLPVARAVTYDFHPEAFIPLLSFTALWGLASKRTDVFVGAALSLLLIKEDAAILILGLCWVAWFAFDVRRPALWTVGSALAYTAVISMLVMPVILGGDSNPLLERYGYLGDNSREIALNAVIRPDLLLDHLDRWAQARAVLLLLAGVGFLPLLRPKLLPPLAVLVLIPLLAEHGQQSVLELHYGVAPGAFAFVLAAVALGKLVNTGVGATGGRPNVGATGGRPSVATCLIASAITLALALAVFAWKSPLPPSFGAETGRFDLGHHADVARSFIDDIPGRVPVSAQATYVPHLSQRRDIYEFPRISGANWVLLDAQRPVPDYDQPNFEACRDQLPALGFTILRSEDGITLYHRTDAPDPAAAPSTVCG